MKVRCGNDIVTSLAIATLVYDFTELLTWIFDAYLIVTGVELITLLGHLRRVRRQLWIIPFIVWKLIQRHLRGLRDKGLILHGSSVDTICHF